MNFFHYQIPPREAAYGRLVANVLGTLRRAVDRRVKEGHEKGEIASRAELSASHLSRILNGNVSNVTLRTVSDLLWATDFDPQDFTADALEDISSNKPPALAFPMKDARTGSNVLAISTGGIVYNLTPSSKPAPVSVSVPRPVAVANAS